MAEATNIRSKVRRAIVAYLTTPDPGPEIANVYDGSGMLDKQAPCVIVSTTRATEDPPDTGNFWVEVEVAIKTPAVPQDESDEADTQSEEAAALKAESEAYETAALNALNVDDLPAQLSAALADFTCVGVAESEADEADQAAGGNMLGEKWRARLYCAPSDL